MLGFGMVSKLSLVLSLLAIAFPIIAGSVLTTLGVGKFSEATIAIPPKAPSPYGILVFSSVYCELKEFSLYVWNMDIKNDVAAIQVRFKFDYLNTSSRKQIFGIQVPFFAQLENTRAHVPPRRVFRALNESAGTSIDIEIANLTAIITGMQIEPESNRLLEANNTSIISFEFEALEGYSTYEGLFWFLWEGFVIRQTFSTYDILVPFSMNDHGLFNVVYTYFPNAHIIYGDSLGPVTFGLSVPKESVKFLGAVPPPTSEELIIDEHNIGWYDFLVPSHPIEDPQSKLIRVSIQDTGLLDIRDRLLFDSGLYMGLGIGLLISGICEAIKFAAKR